MVAKFTYEQYATINQSTAGRFDPRVFVNCLQVEKCCAFSQIACRMWDMAGFVYIRRKIIEGVNSFGFPSNASYFMWYTQETAWNCDKLKPEHTRSLKVCTIVRYKSRCSSETGKIVQCIKPLSGIFPNVTWKSCNHRLFARAHTQVPYGKCREGVLAQ